MRVLISADMEGVSGVSCPEDCMSGTPQYARFRPIFTGEVNAVAGGFFAAGADEVLVVEAHGSMRNLLLEQLDPRVRMITGMHKTYSMMEGIQSRPELVAFVGYHAPAGAEGVLSHTMIGPLLVEARLNGQVMSEGLVNATLAAEFGSRVVLVSGDDKTCEDAQRYAPQAQRVAVKRAVDRYTADCLHPDVTFAMLREAAGKAVVAGPMTTPGPPYECEMEFAVTSAAAACALIPRVERAGGRTVRLSFGTAAELCQCLKIVCRIATATSEQVYG
jgi:D-amino peptidase